jgi:hypothetical protein
MQVAYFQRKPRLHGNFSIELVFEGVRCDLSHTITKTTCHFRPGGESSKAVRFLRQDLKNDGR